MTLDLSHAAISFDAVMDEQDAMQGLLELGRYLKTVDYRFVAVTPETHQHYLRRMAERPVRDLRDIFGWSRSFEQGQVTAEAFDSMSKAGVLTRKGDCWRSRSCSLSMATLLPDIVAPSVVGLREAGGARFVVCKE